ncbi:hypothetical protein [Halomonas tibetensis]|uniref:Type I restriction enzyme R protein N-terminal domain-containing protein n=1 Tax=Halomonas tibetensis TaxID=2259590 RepID=A0ABV7B2Q7_9GAMM
MQDFDSKLEAELFAHLSAERGYPEQSLIRNLSVPAGRGRRYEPDLVVVDPERGDPLAIVEVKGRFVLGGHSSPEDQVRQARYAMGKPGLPGYVVYGNGAERRIVSVSSGADGEDAELSEFPSFSSLLLQARSSDLIAQQKEKKDAAESRRRTVDRFRVACWLLAIIVLAFFIADVKDWLSLSSQQIGLLGAFSALILIPDITKLKLPGVEFERYATNKRAHKEK